MAAARWIEITVRVAPRDVEAVAGVLGAVADGGVVIEPAIRVSDDADFEYELLDAPSAVRAYFPAPLGAADRRSLQRRLADLPLSAPLPRPRFADVEDRDWRLRFAEVEDRDWSEEWRRFFDVLHVGERLVLCPSWRRYDPECGELVIEIDPGRAFGTGQHPTTQMCLLALERHLRPGDDVIDVGTGSGVLAIAAARLGARSVRALDLDVEAVAVARENVERNGVEAVVRVAAGSLADIGSGREPAARVADLIVVNISSTAVVALMPDVARALRPGGLLVGSGFIDVGAAEVEAAAVAAGLRPVSIEAGEEWHCIVAAGS